MLSYTEELLQQQEQSMSGQVKQMEKKQGISVRCCTSSSFPFMRNLAVRRVEWKFNPCHGP